MFDVYQQCAHIIPRISLTSLNKETFASFFLSPSLSLSHPVPLTLDCITVNSNMEFTSNAMNTRPPPFVYKIRFACIKQSVTIITSNKRLNPKKLLNRIEKNKRQYQKTLHPPTNYTDVKIVRLNEIKSKKESMASIFNFYEKMSTTTTTSASRLSNSRKQLFSPLFVTSFFFSQFLW